MQLGRDVALWIGGPRESAGARTNPAELLAGVVREIRKYPTPADALDGFGEPATSDLLLTLQLTHSAGDLRLHSTLTSFGSPHDVTLSELTVESFFPADDATRQRLQQLSTPER